MKVYTIIGGVNGTGKSSLTGVLRAQRNDLGVIVDVDRITALAGASPLEGGKMAIRRIENCLNKGISFTQESTLSGFRTAQTAARAKQDGYTVRLFYVGLDTPEESLARIANRVKRGGHNIGTEDVLRRFAGRWEAVSKVLPYCDEAHFFDNDNGFVEVAEYRNGELLLVGDLRPTWVLELQQYLLRTEDSRRPIPSGTGAEPFSCQEEVGRKCLLRYEDGEPRRDLSTDEDNLGRCECPRRAAG